MKKIIFIVLMIPFVFFSCGGKDSPKSLAKQAYDLSIQAFENALDSDKLNTIIESDEVQNALKELDSKTNKALDESKDTLRTFKNLKP
jgi:hypothetical protein